MPRPRSILVHLGPPQRAAFFTPVIEAAMAKLTDQFHLWTEPKVTSAALAAKLAETQAEVLICGWATPRLPEPLPSTLKYILYVSGSVKTLVSRAHLEQGAVVTNWGNSISRIVAEAALMNILNTLRATAHWTLRMHVEKGWDENAPPAGSLFGRKVGIYGFGFIARELVKLLRPFGAEIMTHAPGIPDEILTEFGVKRAADLNALFELNSVLVNLAPLTAETTDSIGLEQLRWLGVGEALVSVGRGQVINEDALHAVAAEGRVQFALDVFHQEPLPADSPLRGMSNVLLTPHRAGPTDDRMVDAGEFALKNLRAYVNDEPLKAVVTPEIYDAAT